MADFGAVPRSAEGEVKFFPPVSERSEPAPLVKEFIEKYQVMSCGHPCMYLRIGSMYLWVASTATYDCCICMVVDQTCKVCSPR